LRSKSWLFLRIDRINSCLVIFQFEPFGMRRREIAPPSFNVPSMVQGKSHLYLSVAVFFRRENCRPSSSFWTQSRRASIEK
jgi:hypothetical protein